MLPTAPAPDHDWTMTAAGHAGAAPPGETTAPANVSLPGIMIEPEPGTGALVVLGGGGFLMEPENPLLDDFVIGLARRSPARVCFIPTAGGDLATQITRFYRAFAGRCLPTDLTLIGSAALARNPPMTRDLEGFVAAQDVFVVGGGSTLHLLALWRAHGLDRLLEKAWRAGAVLSGVSAGMNCWFRGSITDSFGGLAALDDGLGFLEGSGCPHYDGEPGRRPAYRDAIAAGLPGGYALDDGAALHFAGRTLVEAVSSRPEAGAYRVELREGGVVEERMPVRYLGPPEPRSSSTVTAAKPA